MSKSFFIHFAWAAIAVLAFVFGKGQRGEAPNEVTSDRKDIEVVDRGDDPLVPSPLRRNLESTGNLDSKELRSAQVGIDELVDMAFAGSNPVKKAAAFARLLESVTAENGEEIFAALKDVRASKDQWPLFLFAWGSKAGEQAMSASILDELEEGGMRSYVKSQLLSGWASEDPGGAIAYVKSLSGISVGEDDDSSSTLADGLIAGLATHDAELATGYLFEMADAGGGREAGRYLRKVAWSQVEQLGFESALDWGERLPDGELKAAALDTIVHDYSKRDPQAASEWAEQYADQDWAAAAVSRVAEDWAEDDSLASITWLESLPQGAGRSKASYTAFREWMRRDSIAASEYIIGMEPTPARDHAMWALSENVARSDPEAAVKWAEEIVEPELRSRLMLRAGRSWMGRDSAAASEWLERSGLSAEQREAVLER